jgi:hypothetical protein
LHMRNLKPETSSGLFFVRVQIPEDEMRALVLAIAACAVFGCTLPVGAAALSRDRGSGDPSFRMFSRNNARRGAYFPSVERARKDGPIGRIGVMPLVVRRVWG